MLNELYTFAEPVQVVPFSSLKWGKFTLLHTLSQTDKLYVCDLADNYIYKGVDERISLYTIPDELRREFFFKSLYFFA